MISRPHKTWSVALLDLVLPPSCAGCGRYGTAICSACRASLRPPGLASDAFLASDHSVVVGDALILATAAFAHREAAQRILRRLKYGGGRRLAGLLAELALPALSRLLAVSGPAALVPVPLHRSRQRDRGYNQAELLARELARRTNLTVWPALVRRRATQRQHGLDRTTRLRNLSQAMELSTVRPPAAAHEAMPAVLLVDDILTTGATLEACAVILRAAGVPAVYGFAVAREV
ncbi:MAG: ComF family protein [Candidatus Limnocylindria bacterium]